MTKLYLTFCLLSKNIKKLQHITEIGAYLALPQFILSNHIMMFALKCHGTYQIIQSLNSLYHYKRLLGKVRKQPNKIQSF